MDNKRREQSRKTIIAIILVISLFTLSLLFCSCGQKRVDPLSVEENDSFEYNEEMTEDEKTALIGNRSILRAVSDKELLSNTIAHYCYEYFKSETVSSMTISKVELFNKTWLDDLWGKHRSNYIITVMENGNRYCFMFEGNEVWAIKKDGPEGEIIMAIQE